MFSTYLCTLEHLGLISLLHSIIPFPLTLGIWIILISCNKFSFYSIHHETFFIPTLGHCSRGSTVVAAHQRILVLYSAVSRSINCHFIIGFPMSKYKVHSKAKMNCLLLYLLGFSGQSLICGLVLEGKYINAIKHDCLKKNLEIYWQRLAKAV